jgi:DNA mismatch repair protein MutS2
MAQSGLPIPADPTSEVGTFERVYADIGDEQSIELSLSTFSSHIRNIISALGDLSERTLVLFDEIGAGTDPKEGAALAEAIILYTIRSKARLIATTHYSQLKTLPLEHPEIENASLEFDRETLSPTYRVQIGIPGASYAVEIASRLGMPELICHDAAELLGTSERTLADLIANLESELSRVKEDKKNLSERLQKATELESFYKSQTEKLKQEVDEEKRRALAETEHFIEKTRRETEQLVAELRKSQAARQTVKKIHHHLEKAKEETQQRREAAEAKPAEPIDQTSFARGDQVRVLSLGQVGEIEDISDDKARIRLGALTTTQPLRNLEKIGEAGKPAISRAKSRGTGMEAPDDLSPEIHLRGMTVEEAIDALEKFIDKALIGGLHQIYIIHGKGTGILRKSLTEYLKQHPEIDSLRLGNWNEGGAGVTIARLKE